MKQKIPFDRDKFLNSCTCGCTKSRHVILDGIEQLKESNPELSKYLEGYRDDLWNQQIREEEYREMSAEMGEDALNKKAAVALRAMADKIDEPGWHFMIYCNLPLLPIFSGDDFCSHIEVKMLAAPIGG